MLVLANQSGPGLAVAEVVQVAVVSVPAVLLVAALARHQPSTVAAFEQHRLSGAHTLAAEALADQVPLLDSIMVVIG